MIEVSHLFLGLYPRPFIVAGYLRLRWSGIDKAVGLVRALITPYLEKAKEEGVPAWLEATTPHSRDVYAHLGFREVEQIKIGEGKADRTGNAVAGGEGITIYCMIAEPQ